METPFSNSNILVGSATLYVAPVGTALPALPITAGGPLVVTTPWAAVGYTDAGNKFTYTPSFTDISVDEAFSPVYTLKTSEKLVISAALAESSLENLQRATSGAVITTTAAGVGIPGKNVLQVGGSAAVTEFAVLLVGKSPQGFMRLINIYRTVATGAVDFTYKKNDKIMVPLELTALNYSANPVGNQLFQIVDKTADPTS